METRVNLFLLELYVRLHPEFMRPLMLSGLPDDLLVTAIPLIVHLKADSNYTHITLLDHPHPVVIPHCLKECAEKLPEDCFMRVHKSDVINLFMVTHYYPQRHKVMLLDGTTVLISSLRLHEFREKYLFWFGKFPSEMMGKAA